MIKTNNMNYENFTTGFNKPTIITAQQYGTKVSVEIDHSDTNIDELFDAFQTLIIGLGYHESAWKGWIVERAEEYKEEENEKCNEDKVLFHERVKQSIKDGLERYRVTDEDESEYDDYGMKVNSERVGFEWGDEAEEDVDNWFNGEEFKPNNVLIDAKKQYDEQVKMDAKKTKTKTKK